MRQATCSELTWMHTRMKIQNINWTMSSLYSLTFFLNNISTTQYTRSNMKLSNSMINKSAITDHVTKQNHITNWEGLTMIDKESNRSRCYVRESIWIKKTAEKINHDEGIYNLAHIWEVIIPSELAQIC